MNSASKASFSNSILTSLSVNAGGALYIYNQKYEVFLQFCYFESCSASRYVTQTSSGRKNYAAGGSCYIDAKYLNISNVYTTKCSSSYYGSSLFCVLPITTKSYIHCLSDCLSGGGTSFQYEAVHVFDKAEYYITNINNTYPNIKRYAGAFHLGMYPNYYSISFLHIVFNEGEGSIACSFSLPNTGQNDIKYGHIEKSNVPANSGIIGFVYGNHHFSYFNFIDCSGNLICYQTSHTAAQSVTFDFCYFHHDITINSVTNLNEKSETIEIHVIEECKFEYTSNINIVSCQIATNTYINIVNSELIIFLLSNI